jgi:PAS domain S-box-containing protein
MKFRKTFRLKTVLGIAVIEALLLFIIGWSSLNYLEQSNVKNLTEHALTTAQLFSTTTKDALLATDLATLETHVTELIKNPGIIYSRVVSSDAGVLAEAGDTVALQRPFKEDRTLADVEDNSFDVKADIREGGYLYGHVEVGLATEFVGQLITDARNQFVLLAGLEMILVALFSLGLGYLLTRQLDGLVEAARRLAIGEFDHKIPVRTYDELGQTAHTFNRMSEELKRTYDSLSTALLEATEKSEELVRSEGRLRGIMESVIDALITIDQHGSITMFNPAAEKIFGYASAEVIGKNVRMLMPEPYHSEHDNYLKHYIETGVAKIIGIGREAVGLKKNGEQFPMDLAISEAGLGNNHFFIGIVRDISERKKVENSLLVAKRSAEDASNAKSTFLANMSHELRTPLNAILGYAQILQGEVGLSGKQMQGLKTIKESGDHLLQLINDILEISKIEVGRIDLVNQVFSLDVFLNNINNMMNVRANDRAIQFTHWKGPGVPANVIGDEKRLRQVVLNLLNNALKFTDKGVITFGVELIEGSPYSTEKTVRFQVQDSGVGIAKEQQQKIFQPFYQVVDRKRNTEGTGLGLAISRQLLSLMGGELHLKSEPGKGSLFWFDLKMEECAEGVERISGAEERVAGYRGERKHILVVDDNMTNRDVLKHLLSHLGFDLSEAENGKIALERIAEKRPDAILLDLRMPVMDGPELLKHVKSDAEMKDIPVIAISASVSEKVQRKVMQNGCVGFLSKPFKMNDLLDVLGRNLQLEWVYEEKIKVKEEPVEVENIRLPEPLSETMQKDLMAAASRGNVKKLLAILENMDRLDTDGAKWRDILVPLAQNYRFDEILQILNNEKGNSDAGKHKHITPG